MSVRAKYEPLLQAIVDEADKISMKYFRSDTLGIEKKGDGSVVTLADKAVEAMALKRVAESGLTLDYRAQPFRRYLLSRRSMEQANPSE